MGTAPTVDIVQVLVAIWQFSNSELILPLKNAKSRAPNRLSTLANVPNSSKIATITAESSSFNLPNGLMITNAPYSGEHCPRKKHKQSSGMLSCSTAPC